jgi:hypothetical protein
MRIGAQWVGVVTIAVASVCTAVQAQPGRGGTEPERTYMSPNGWTISYPGDWTIDTTNPNDVPLRAPANDGMCTIFSGPPLRGRFKTADEFADRALAHNEQSFKGRGLQLVVVGRRRIALPTGVTATEVLTELRPGGKSRRLYGVVGDGQGWAIDCETFARNWEKLEGTFGRIFNSFSLKSDTAAQQVYRWVDKDGVVHFTQTPPPETQAEPPKTKPP